MGDGRFPAELLVEFGEFLGESRPFRSVRRASSKLPWATYSCPSDRGPMGEALLRNFGQIAYMANDEAEKKSANGAGLASRQYGGVSPAGVIWRTERGQVRHTGFAPPLESMDWLPFPIYQDYFERMRQYAFAKQ